MLRLAWSADGQTLVSAGEDRLIKVWNADTMTIRQTLERQSDWASGLAISAWTAQRLPWAESMAAQLFIHCPRRQQKPSGHSRHWPKCRRRLTTVLTTGDGQAPEGCGSGADDSTRGGRAIATPGVASGRIFAAANSQTRDHDLFRFQAKAGDQWVVETKAARDKSPLDSKLEILDKDGQPVPRDYCYGQCEIQ